MSVFQGIGMTSLRTRERLVERLNQGLNDGKRLTLVSAPAGYGKSMLVSSWVESIEQPCAWLSLDETDSDITEFLTYVIAAIRTVEPTAFHIHTRIHLGLPRARCVLHTHMFYATTLACLKDYRP